MSLRTRLLIAIGVIALVALAIADVVTYSALQSFLYQRVDQQLDQSHGRFEQYGWTAGRCSRRTAGPGPFTPRLGAGPTSQPPERRVSPPTPFQSFAVQVRYLSGGSRRSARAARPM